MQPGPPLPMDNNIDAINRIKRASDHYAAILRPIDASPDDDGLDVRIL